MLESQPLKIFVSYVRTDAHKVKPLLESLKSWGHELWLDVEHLLPGQRWRLEVEKAIRDADVVIVCVSEAWRKSSSARFELKKALDLVDRRPDRIFLVPVILETMESYPEVLQDINAAYLDPEGGSEGLRKALQSIGQERVAGYSTSQKPAQNLFVRRVRLSNIRCFDQLELEFGSDSDLAAWVMLLGDNAAGKSTILRSIALGLCQEGDAVALMKNLPGSFLRQGANRGRIALNVVEASSGKEFEIETHILRGDEEGETIRKKAPRDFPWSSVFVCGYGAHRFGQSPWSPETYSTRDAVATLFDDDAPLQNPELVLLRQPAEVRDDIEKRLLQILMLDDFRVAYPRTGPEIRGSWGAHSIVSMSDGYRTTTQWVLDFIGWLIHAGRLVRHSDIGGILLIDEIEQHLHPRWQRFIVERLRQQFPKTQILSTTHTPLVAAGLADLDRAKLFRLQRANGCPAEPLEIPLESIRGKRADQVLASEAFGLVTSRSPGSMRDIDRFAELSRKDISRSPTEEAERASLSASLDRSLRVGESQLEQVVEEAVAAVLEKNLLEVDPETIDREARRQLQEVFSTRSSK